MIRCKRHVLNLIVALGVVALAGPAAAQGRPRPEGAPASDPPHGAPAYDKRGFKKDERKVIEEHFKANPSTGKRLPPGLAKKNKLPPGWQKKVERGEVVPDDVWRHRTQLPPEVVRKLPPNPPGTVTVRIDDKVVRVIEQTREVLDIFGLPSF